MTPSAAATDQASQADGQLSGDNVFRFDDQSLIRLPATFDSAFYQCNSLPSSPTSYCSTPPTSVGNGTKLTALMEGSDEWDSGDDDYEDEWVDHGLLPGPHRSPTSNQSSRSLGSVDDSDDDVHETVFSLILTNKVAKQLTFYRAILAPYIESYWLTVNSLQVTATSNLATSCCTIHNQPQSRAASAESDATQCSAVVEPSVEHTALHENSFIKNVLIRGQKLILKKQICFGKLCFVARETFT